MIKIHAHNVQYLIRKYIIVCHFFFTCQVLTKIRWRFQLKTSFFGQKYFFQHSSNICFNKYSLCPMALQNASNGLVLQFLAVIRHFSSEIINLDGGKRRSVKIYFYSIKWQIFSKKVNKIEFFFNKMTNFFKKREKIQFFFF